MKMIRLAVATAGVVSVALLLVAAASAKPPAPPTNVACSQQALVDAINAANSAGGGTLNLAHGCDYQLTSSPDDSENGLPAITTAIKINGNQATIDGTDSFRDFEVDGPGGNLSAHDLTITGGSAQDFGGGIANLGRHCDAGSRPGERQQRRRGRRWYRQRHVRPVERSHAHAPQQLGERQSADSPTTRTTALGGGGIANVDGTLTLDHSQVNGNTAEGFVGGGIASGDYLRLGRSDRAHRRPQPGERQHRSPRQRRRDPEPARAPAHRRPQPGRRQHVA